MRAALFTAATAATTTAALATAPGIRVNNTVTVTFDVGTVTQDTETAEAGFVVDRKIDMLVANQGPIPDGRPKQTGRELVYKVVNEGNAAQGYDIDVTPTGDLAADFTLDTGTGTLGASRYRIYISEDTTVAGGTVYDPAGFDLANTPAAFDGAASTFDASDDEFYVIIVINIPSDAQDDEFVDFSVKATALNDAETAALEEDTGNGLDNAGDNEAAVDIVFADGTKTTGSDGTDVAEDGKHTDYSRLTVASAELTITKAVTIVSEDTQDTFDCAASADPAIDDNTQGAIPGACLEYTITVANGLNASEDATNVAITDNLPTGVTFVSFFDKAAWSNAAHSTGTISASLDNDLVKGQSRDLVFRVTVD